MAIAWNCRANSMEGIRRLHLIRIGQLKSFEPI